MKKEYTPSESEENAISKALLLFAWNALAGLEDDNLSQADGAKLILRCCVSVEKEQLNLKDEIAKKMKAKLCYFHTNTGDIIATAVACRINSGNIEEYHPQSIIGQRLMMFSKAQAAMTGMQICSDALAQDESWWGQDHAENALRITPVE